MFKRGFTLIELLIVIAVIAILVGIAVPRFLGMRDEGNAAKAAAECSTLKAAVEAYRIHDPQNRLPATGATWENVLLATRPQIIDVALLDPFSTTTPRAQYSYARSANGEFYAIYSIGHDRETDIGGIGNDGVITLAGSCTEYTATCTATEDVFATNGTAP